MSNTNLIEIMRSEASARYPNEACGLIIADGKHSVVIACRNASEFPHQQFLIHADDHAAALEQGEIVGVWHTHVNIPAKPSDADKAGCELSEVPWFIISVSRDREGADTYSELVAVEPTGFVMPYLERPYVFGVFDCWTLARDFYSREFKITLSEFPRIPRFWARGHDFFGENWKTEGFTRLIEEQPEKGDLFLLKTDTSGNCNHIAISLGGERMIHHTQGRLSREEIYGGYWLKHTAFHLRWKGFVNAD